MFLVQTISRPPRIAGDSSSDGNDATVRPAIIFFAQHRRTSSSRTPGYKAIFSKRLRKHRMRATPLTPLRSLSFVTFFELTIIFFFKKCVLSFKTCPCTSLIKTSQQAWSQIRLSKYWAQRGCLDMFPDTRQRNRHVQPHTRVPKQ